MVERIVAQQGSALRRGMARGDLRGSFRLDPQVRGNTWIYFRDRVNLEGNQAKKVLEQAGLVVAGTPFKNSAVQLRRVDDYLELFSADAVLPPPFSWQACESLIDAVVLDHDRARFAGALAGADPRYLVALDSHVYFTVRTINWCLGYLDSLRQGRGALSPSYKRAWISADKRHFAFADRASLTDNDLKQPLEFFAAKFREVLPTYVEFLRGLTEAIVDKFLTDQKLSSFAYFLIKTTADDGSLGDDGYATGSPYLHRVGDVRGWKPCKLRALSWALLFMEENGLQEQALGLLSLVQSIKDWSCYKDDAVLRAELEAAQARIAAA